MPEFIESSEHTCNPMYCHNQKQQEVQVQYCLEDEVIHGDIRAKIKTTLISIMKQFRQQTE
jgi:hypothetical protein